MPFDPAPKISGTDSQDDYPLDQNAMADLVDEHSTAIDEKADIAGVKFDGATPVAVDEVTAAALVELPDGAVNGFVVKLDSASAGYGQGQAFMVLEEGVGDATDQSENGSVLFRVDPVGGIGTNSGLHIATGLRKAVPSPPAALWITPSQDVTHVLCKRPPGGALPFFVGNREDDTPAAIITSNGHITTRTTAGTADAAALYAGDAGLIGFRAIFATRAASTAGLAILGEAAQTANLLQIGQGATVYSRFNKFGYFITRKTTAIPDGDITAGDVALWFDQTNGAAKLMIKAKQANGTVVTGEVALS